MFYCITSLIGLKAEAEYRTSCGRIDLLIETDKDVYIFEFKLNQPIDEAFAQIEEKCYADMFLSDPRPVHRIGVNFDPKTKSLKDWKVQ